MKRLVIVRHAKAVPYGYDDDFSRALTGKGETDAQIIGRHLQKEGILPDLMISSPALRARSTAQIFAESLGYPSPRIREEEALYEGLTTGGFVQLLHTLPAEAQTVFVFGHNPGLSYYVSNLLHFFHGDMPTCSTVGIDFDVQSWTEVEPRSGAKAFQLIPSMFNE
ncbi:MAG TPA: histidine phosphatase family protein [Prolixibacteraceae bacterium]|nr:histidine phosphatase family protein [Prolixibacteraceae bacterium]